MILKMIEDGKVSAEEGLKLLDAVGKGQEDTSSKALTTDLDETAGDSYKQKHQRKETSEETPFSKLTGFFESAIQKVKDGDFDFNFGAATEVDHIFQHQNITPKTVHVLLDNGSVEVIPWDKPDVRIECQVKVYRMSDEEEAKTFFLNESTFSVTEEKLLFETKSKTMKVNATLYVPEASYTHMKLYTFNGSLKGDSLKVETFEANTTNGLIKTEGLISKKASIETVNGSINCEGSKLQLLEAKTLNGTIKVSGAIQDADVETVNGSISYEIEDTGESGYVDLKTTTGSLKLHVSDQVRFDGKLKSNVGSINNRLAFSEVVDEKKDIGQRYMQVTANSNQSTRVRVHAVANTGSITLQDK